jgi:hypothetical protein
MSDGYKYQLNLKFGEQYKETLFNIQGDSQEEFQQNVAWAVDNVDGIVGAAVAYGVAYNIKKPQDDPQPQKSGGWSNNGSQQSQQQPAQVNQSGPAPTCRHGEMKFVPAGYSQRTKKNYDAFWSCQGPRNEQCDTVKA